MIFLEYPSIPVAFRDLIKRSIGLDGFSLEDAQTSSSSITLMIQDLSSRIPLAHVGFRSRRWLDYVDDYLYGGSPFLKFLETPFHKSPSSFHFGGSHNHTHGSCINNLTLWKDTVYLSSRVCDLCPTGVLDLTLLWMVSKKCRRISKAVWTIPRLKSSVWQVAGYKKLGQIHLNESSLKNQLDYHLKKDVDSIKFMRAKKLLRSREFLGSNDEESIILSPVRITPVDLERLFGLKGLDIRNFLRDKYGWSANGDGSNSYAWKSYDDPIFQSVLKKFGLSTPSISIEEVAYKRSTKTW